MVSLRHSHIRSSEKLLCDVICYKSSSTTCSINNNWTPTSDRPTTPQHKQCSWWSKSSTHELSEDWSSESSQGRDITATWALPHTGCWKWIMLWHSKKSRGVNGIWISDPANFLSVRRRFYCWKQMKYFRSSALQKHNARATQRRAKEVHEPCRWMQLDCSFSHHT